MTRSKKIGLVSVLAVLAVAVFGWTIMSQPAYSLTMDVNPSIEIVSNRLDKVLEIKPLNDDAEAMLREFEIKDSNLTKTIEDLADLMVLKGYISGGKDNLVMITVSDNASKQDVVDRLNAAIAAYLENKQIEATIVNQSIAEEYDAKTGRELFALRISELDDDLDYQQLSQFSLNQLVDFADARNIDPEVLFSKMLRTKEVKRDYQQFIGEAKAKEIALGLINGKIVEFELDDDDDDGDDNPEYEIKIVADGYEYEIELDAYTGRVLEFERDDLDDDDRDDNKSNKAAKSSNSSKTNKPVQNVQKHQTTTAKKQVIGAARAKEIALGKVKGRIVEFELDDGKYEIEIVGNGYEYEIEIDAYSGKIVEFERDDYDDDDDDDD